MASLIGFFALGASMVAFAHYQRVWQWSDLADYDPRRSRGPIQRFFGRLYWGLYRGPDAFPPLSNEEARRVRKRLFLAVAAFFASGGLTALLLFAAGPPPGLAVGAVIFFWVAIGWLDYLRAVNRWSGG